MPPDFARLVVLPGPDKAHIQLRLNRDVTAMSDDQQKLLVHYVTQALTEFETMVRKMNRIEAAAKLAKLERVKAVKSNGQ